MSVDTLLRLHVLGDVTIGMLVGTRMYPIRLPEKATLPAITFQQISDVRDGHLRGVAGTARARYQIDAYAAQPKEAKALAGWIRQRLDGFQGLWTDGSSPEDTVYVERVAFESGMDLFDEDILGGSARHSADYFISHRTNGGTV